MATVTVSAESLVALQTATESAFQGVEFEILAPEEDRTGRIVSGSMRSRELIDTLTGEPIVALESHSLFRRKKETSEIETDHVLVIMRHDGMDHAVSLDNGEIIRGGNDTDPEVIKTKILRALGATLAGII